MRNIEKSIRPSRWLKYLVCFTFFLISFSLSAQNTVKNSLGEGLTFTAQDSSFSVNMGFRFQTLYQGQLNLKENSWGDRFMIRRSRLKFNGFVYDPALTFKIELGLSSRDIGGGNLPEFGNASRVILDAVAKWKINSSWTLWMGQTKLPGNRERVVSSQSMQFVDRSLLNSRFNIDRDIGVQIWHKSRLGGKSVFKQGLSISMGEGRNIIAENAGGYDYTLRLDFLPFGEFKNKGDYFGSDLEREEKPKLAIGATFDFNDGASRQRGQLGDFVRDAQGNAVITDLSTLFIDAMFKYRGFSFMGEFADKESSDEVLANLNDGEALKFVTGRAVNLQAGYLFSKNEVAIRYTAVQPDSEVFSALKREKQYTLGFSRYISGHDLKIQTDLSFTEGYQKGDALMYRFQLEVSL